MKFSKAILANGFSVIADIKPRSPEHGDLLRGRSPAEIALALEAAGCPCLTNVTESKLFGGSLEILQSICRAVKIPVLRKDFISTAEDLKASKSAGAAAVLIICSSMPPEKAELLYRQSLEMELEPMVEVLTARDVHRAQELGVNGVLVGSALLLAEDLAGRYREFTRG